MPKAQTKRGAHIAVDLKEHFAHLVISSAMRFVAKLAPGQPSSTLRADVPALCSEALIRALELHGFFDFHVPSTPSEVSTHEEEAD